MEFLPVAAMVILVVKVIDFLRYARARDVNGVLTQLFAWVAGVAVVSLVAHTNWAGGIAVGSFTLAKLGWWSLVFYGMSIASAGSLAKDAIKAVDSSQSAAIPILVPPAATSQPG